MNRFFILIGSCLSAAAMINAAQLRAEETSAARSEYLASKDGSAFYVKATGDIEYESAYSVSSNKGGKELFWDCKNDTLRAGFAVGQMMTPSWETLVFVVNEPVGPGQTGTFNLSGIQWANGQEPMPGQPANSPFKAPRNFEGSGGQLQLETHVSTSRSEQRIQGVAKGQVTSKNGDLTVQLHIELDLKKACGI